MKKNTFILIVITGIVNFICAQTVKIGNQVWMTKNLNVSTFRNGDLIPQAKTAEEWNNSGINKKPAWCYYENNSNNGTKYGKLYNWHAVNDPRGLAPVGYHIPSDSEWEELKEFLGDELGSKLKNTTGWPNFVSFTGNGTNTSGFSALPGGLGGWPFGYGYTGNMNWNNLTSGYWWSSSEDTTALRSNDLQSGKIFVFVEDYEAYARKLDVYKDADFDHFHVSKDRGLSVRCVKD